MRLEEIKKILKNHQNFHFVDEQEGRELINNFADRTWFLTPSNQHNKLKIFYRINNQTESHHLRYDAYEEESITSEKVLSNVLKHYTDWRTCLNKPITPEAAKAVKVIDWNYLLNLKGLIPSSLLSQEICLQVSSIAAENELAVICTNIISKSGSELVCFGTLNLYLSHEELKIIATEKNIPLSKYILIDNGKAYSVDGRDAASNSLSQTDLHKQLKLEIISEAYDNVTKFQKIKKQLRLFDNHHDDLKRAMSEAFYERGNLKGTYVARALCAASDINVLEIDYFPTTHETDIQTIKPVKIKTEADGRYVFVFTHSNGLTSSGNTIPALLNEVVKKRKQEENHFVPMTEDEYLKLLASYHIRANTNDCRKSLKLENQAKGRIIITFNEMGTVDIDIPEQGINKNIIISYFDFMYLVAGKPILGKPELIRQYQPEENFHLAPQPVRTELSKATSNQTIGTSQWGTFGKDFGQQSEDRPKVFKSVDEILADCHFHFKDLGKEEAYKVLEPFSSNEQIFITRKSSQGNDWLGLTYRVFNERTTFSHGIKKTVLFDRMNPSGEMNVPMTKSQAREKLVNAINKYIIDSLEADNKQQSDTNKIKISGKFQPLNQGQEPSRSFTNSVR